MEVDELEQDDQTPMTPPIAVPGFHQMVKSDVELNEAMAEERSKATIETFEERAAEEIQAVKAVIAELEDKGGDAAKKILASEEVEDVFGNGQVVDFEKYPYM